MKEFENNLPARLLKWAHRQEENFLTESLAHLLQYLQENEPSIAVKFFRYLSNGLITLDPIQIRSVKIDTQLVTAEGRPDLVLKSKDSIVFIEVKKESGFGHTQIDRYQSHLDASSHKKKGLILLTRYPIAEDHQKKTAGHVRWHQLGSKLRDLNAETKENVQTILFVNQFLGLLFARGMLMTQVQSDVVGGLRSLNNLLLMLGEACNAQKLVWSYDIPNPGWLGIKIKTESRGNYRIGIETNSPHLIQFGSWNEIEQFEQAESLGFSPYEKKGRVSAWCEYDLNQDSSKFFTLSPEEQYEALAAFLHNSICSYERLSIKKFSSW